MSAGELAGQVFDMCPPVAVAKTIAGIDAQAPGPGGPQHNFELGGAHAEIAPGAALPSVSFSLSGVRDGIHDLVAWATGASASDKVEIIRDINLADGGSLEPVNLGRDGMNQSLNLATVTNPLSAETYTFSQYYLTTSACTMNPIGTFVQTKGASGVIHGVPGIVQRPTDFHMVSVLGIVQPVSRTATLSYHDGGNVNVALPSPIAKPDIARLVGPYMRFSAAFADLSGEFDSSVGIIVSDATNRVDISTTIAASGRSNISLAIPDFSGVAGWNNSFAIAAGASVTAIVTATGGPAGARCSEGARSVSSSLTFQF
jgi:hypothetical protein